jgi:hypothetical protein
VAADSLPAMSIHQSSAVDQLVLEGLAHATDRGLGDLQVRSNLGQRQFGQVSYLAARNLLIKAARAVAAGDRQRATRYVDRATDLPFDDEERANPAVFEAHMHLYEIVTDAVDTCAVDCSCWLDAAEAALTTCGGHAREDLLETLAAVDQEYRLQPREHRRVRTLVAGAPEGDVLERRVDDDRPTQSQVIFELLQVANAYETALVRLHDEPV